MTWQAQPRAPNACLSSSFNVDEQKGDNKEETWTRLSCHTLNPLSKGCLEKSCHLCK